MMNNCQDWSESNQQEVNLDYESLLNKSQENIPTSGVPEMSASSTTNVKMEKLSVKLRVDGKPAFVFEGKCEFQPE